MADRRIAIVEAAYDLEIPRSEWLTELGQPMRESLDGVSAYVFEINQRDGKFVLSDHQSEDPRVAEQLQRTVAMLPQEMLNLFFGTPLLATSSSDVLGSGGIEFESTPLPALYAEVGFKDVFAMSAFDPLGDGVGLGVGLRERSGPPQDQRVLWTQVAAHVAAAFRLRRRLGGRKVVDEASAVLRTDGKVDHAESGVDSEQRELLRQAVDRVERARARGRATQEALELWQSLIGGQWSLADHFEGNGRRFYVAVRNPPEIAESKALTRREAEVVSYLACGTKTQTAAYALGLDEVTVRGYLRTALNKLGMRSRAELIAVRSMLVERRRIEPAEA
jgi:DNA-binding CsgD family transcriptional regulator